MLTDAAVRAAKPAEKPYKLTDHAGLYLHVTPAGSKLWRMRYEFDRKEKLLSFGRYPDPAIAERRAAFVAAVAAAVAGEHAPSANPAVYVLRALEAPEEVVRSADMPAAWQRWIVCGHAPRLPS